MEYFDYPAPAAQRDKAVDVEDIEEFLDASHERATERLEEALDHIAQQLEARATVHETTMTELETTLEWYVDRLQTHYKRLGGGTQKTTELKQRITELYGALRSERRNHWLDTQELVREQRELQQDLAELEGDELIGDFL